MSDVRLDAGAVVAEFIDSSWDPEMTLLEWRHRLIDAGLGTPIWPREFGGLSCSASDADAITEALRGAGVPGTPDSVAMSLAAPTLLEHDRAHLRKRHLRRCATGEDIWCQLFSEPGAGSDLAGLTSSATLDGDEWRVSGQKVWNTGALHADYGLLLARTDWNVPKHRGITYFVLPMRQPGVVVRPLRQMNGHSSFNEVFLDDARIPVDGVIGDIGGGWTVALTTLAHERRLTRSRAAQPRRDGNGRVWREAIAEATAISEPHKWYPQRAGRVDLLIEHATSLGRSKDHLVRQSVAATISMSRAARWNAERSASARAAGRPPGPEGSLGKLATSNIARSSARTHSLIAGSTAMLAPKDASLGAVVAEILVSVPGQSIAGGTDEIQHNIIGERVLGLPKEPSADIDRAFRDVPRNL